MRVDDALRPAGRPARVAHRRGLVLVELGVAPVVRRRAGEQLLVRVLDDEDVLDPGLGPGTGRAAARGSGRRSRPCRRRGRDVREVVRVQAEVQRVQREPAARDPEVALHVLVVVPAERRNAVAALEAESLQRDRELLRAPRQVAVAVAVEALVGEAGDDLLVRRSTSRRAGAGAAASAGSPSSGRACTRIVSAVYSPSNARGDDAVAQRGRAAARSSRGSSRRGRRRTASSGVAQ